MTANKPTRPIEMGVAFQHGQWTTEVVDIPADTPEDMILSVASRVVRNIEAIGLWVYNSMDSDCPEVPKRLVHWVTLSFDADQTTEGTDIEQAKAAIDQVNAVLQRNPYGIGARLD